MAIDTAFRRASAALVQLPFGRVATIPMGIVNAAQRLAIGFAYSGILPTGAGSGSQAWIEITPASNTWSAIPEA